MLKFEFEGQYPTPAELYALEQWAQRQRSRALAELIRSGAAALSRFARRVFAPSARTIRKHVAHHA